MPIPLAPLLGLGPLLWGLIAQSISKNDEPPTTAQTLQAWRADTNARCKAAKVDAFTRRSAARFLGVQPTHYDRWEKGTAIPNPDQVARISAMTHIPPEMLTVPNTLPSVKVVAARPDEGSRTASGLSLPDPHFVDCFEIAHDLPTGSVNPLIYTSKDGYTFYFIGGKWVDNMNPELVDMTFEGDWRGPTALLKD